MAVLNPLFGGGNQLYQQMLQQYQQNMANQQQSVTIFYNVPSEEVARHADVQPNTTTNFINTNEGYIYIKSAGSSILEPGKFTKIKLEVIPEDGEAPVTPKEPEKPQMNLDEYLTKKEFESKFEPYEKVITEMQEVVKELKG